MYHPGMKLQFVYNPKMLQMLHNSYFRLTWNNETRWQQHAMGLLSIQNQMAFIRRNVTRQPAFSVK